MESVLLLKCIKSVNALGLHLKHLTEGMGFKMYSEWANGLPE